MSKFLGNPANGKGRPLLEFVASRLARHFGIPVPEAAAVMVDADSAKVLGERFPTRAAEFEANIGFNFASAFLDPADPWPVNQPIPSNHYLGALNVFAFDALIQNPDRQAINPNLFVYNGSIHVYDHELSFSSVQETLASASPWDLKADRYLSSHVFRNQLAKDRADLSLFEARLTALSDGILNDICQEIPPEWMHPHLDGIDARLKGIRAHSDEFVAAVRERLP